MRQVAGVVALMLAGVSVASAQSLTCVANAPVPPLVRNPGLSELVGDIVLTCNGTVPAGGIQAPFSVFLNTTMTSRLIGGTSEVIVLVNEPPPAAQTPGVNLFQGVVAANSVTFTNVPFSSAAGGTVTNWVLRITNIRANAAALGAGQIVTFTTVANPGVVLQNPQQTVGFVQNALTFDSSCGTLPSSVNLSFTELFATVFKPRGSTSQNVVGLSYNTESGFTPSPIIPGVGIADTGTQLGAALSGIPAGVQITAPALVTAGGLALTAVSPVGGGPVPIVAGSASIIYEVIAASALSAEGISVPLTVSQMPLPAAFVRGTLSPTSIVGTASPVAPIPRFGDNSTPVPFGACAAVPSMHVSALIILAISLLAIGWLMSRRPALR